MNFTRARFYRKFYNVALSVTFGLLILAPGVSMLSGMDLDIESREKRELADIPGTPDSLETLNKWPKAFEEYFGDRLGFRQILVGAWSGLNYHLLGTSISDKVIAGKDGWLLYGDDTVLRSYRRFKTFSDKELERLDKSLVLFNQWMTCQDIKFLLVIAPNKSTIYPDKMPGRYTRSVDKTAIDQVAESVKNTGVAFVDIRNELENARLRAEEVYYKTDTHWNSWGAFPDL